MSEVYDASDPKQVREKGKRARLADRDRLDTLRHIMSQRNGRAFLNDILERCHVFRTSFTTNALAIAFAEGERNVGLQLFADITAHCAEDYIRMMNERNAAPLEKKEPDDVQD